MNAIMTHIETASIFGSYDENNTTLATKFVKICMDRWEAFNQTNFNNNFTASATQETVEIANIINCQRFVIQEILETKKDNYTSTESTIQLFKFENKLYLNNGYHRISAMLLANVETANVEIVDLDSTDMSCLAWY